MRFATALLLLVVACGGPATADNGPEEGPASTVSFGSDERTETTIAPSPTTVTTRTGVGETQSAPTPEGLTATGPDAVLIAFEAQWLCDVQRQTFDSPGAVDEALNSSLGAVAIGRDDYDAFKAGLTENPAARKQVLDLFVADCS